MATSTGPKGSAADVRNDLLAATRRLLEERGLDPFSLREVADAAGVTPAMVRYYFDDRQGLLMCLLDEDFDTLLTAVGSQAPGVMRRLVQQITTMPWLAILMMQCVYAGGELREHFIETHVPRILPVLSGLLGEAPRGHRDLAVLSLLSMLVFPHLARPALAPALGITFDERFVQNYADHLTTLISGD